MCSLVIEDVFYELKDENKRLSDELSIATERLKILIEFKITFDLFSNKIKQSLELNEWQKFEKLLTKFNQSSDARVTNSDNTVVDVNPFPPQKPIVQQSPKVKKVKKNVVSLNRPDEKNRTVKLIKLSYVGPEKRVVRSEYNYQPKVTNDQKNHKCDYKGCDKTFTDKNKMQRHKNLVHLKAETFYCEYGQCLYYTHLKPAFDNHIAQHDNYAEVTAQKSTSYVCQFEGCGKAFDTRKSWIGHQRNHKHVRRVECTEPGCDYLAFSRANLKRHMIKHSDIRPFVCEVEGCDKRFKLERNYKNHLDIHKNKYFKCPYDECDKTFESNSGLHKHKKAVHIKEQLYVCEWPGCEYSTYSKSNHSGHQRVHSNERHSCDYPDCSAKYKERSILRAHQLKQHGIGEGYVCSWPGCEHKAITKNKLIIHEKSHNKDN